MRLDVYYRDPPQWEGQPGKVRIITRYSGLTAQMVSTVRECVARGDGFTLGETTFAPGTVAFVESVDTPRHMGVETEEVSSAE